MKILRISKKLLFFSIIVLDLFVCIVNAQTESEKKLTWDYPLRYGMPGWETLKTYEERLNAYNIPVEIIKNISTEELINVCLAYPNFKVIHAYNDRRTGLNKMMRHFNGFTELFARNDAAKELIKLYSKVDPLAIGDDWTLLQQGRYGFYINYIELLLAHEMIIEKLDEQDTHVLLNEVAAKYQLKKQRSDVYALWGLSPTAGLCLSILDKSGEFSRNNDKLLLLKQTFMSDEIAVLDSIVESIKK